MRRFKACFASGALNNGRFRPYRSSRYVVRSTVRSFSSMVSVVVGGFGRLGVGRKTGVEGEGAVMPEAAELARLA